MILVVGGQGSGKREYVRSLGVAEEEAAFDLHLFLKEREEVTDEIFADLLRKKIVVCNEVGCGIVPADAADRAWRDRVGRTCARLAARAERVVRLCCGIPIVIKDGGGNRDGRA